MALSYVPPLPGEWETLMVGLSACVGALALYHFGLAAPRVAAAMGRPAERVAAVWPARGAPAVITVQRLLGGVVLAGIPGVAVAVAFGPEAVLAMGIRGTRLGPAIGLGAAGGAALAVLMRVTSTRVEVQERYPAMRVMGWSRRLTVLDLATWACYLFGYEYCLRGVLLGAGVAALGPLGGLATTTVVYALIHLPQGMEEALGSLALGAAFGFLALLTGGFLVAFLAHVVMAVSVDLFTAPDRERA